MGQVPAKYFYPSPPYGSSDAVNTVNAAQPQAANPQTPLLPPNFIDPGKAASPAGAASPISPQSPALGPARFGLNNPLGSRNPLLKGLFGQQ